MTIKQAIKVYNLNIAIQAGRSYGEDTDIQLKTLTNKLTVIEGVNSIDRIMKMMINLRIDAIVEFPTVIATNLEGQRKNSILERTRAYQTQNGSGFAHGYIACSKTAEGESIIEIINGALMTKDMQNMLINLNTFYFPEISHLSILNEWLSLTDK